MVGMVGLHGAGGADGFLSVRVREKATRLSSMFHVLLSHTLEFKQQVVERVVIINLYLGMFVRWRISRNSVFVMRMLPPVRPNA